MALKDESSPTTTLQPPGASHREHPLFSGSQTVGMVSGENPKFKSPPGLVGHEHLGKVIQGMGLKAEPRNGRYGAPERSWMVYGPTREQMYQLGKAFGQESVVYSDSGRHELMYTNGPNTGRAHHGLDHEFHTEDPGDYYTHMPELGGYLRLNFDWDHLHPTNLAPDHAVDALNTRAQIHKSARELKTLVKMDPAQTARAGKPHPNSYGWHDPHTDHHPHVMSPGVVLVSSGLRKDEAAAHPHTSSYPKNDQAAGVGTSTYARYALPYGTVDKGSPTDLNHYPYHGKGAEVDRLLRDHGYNHYYAGGRYGRPDLANRNYNTKNLMIYDPSPGSGGDFGHEQYTDSWRKVHELAHALSYQDLNGIYGEGRRIGKLGTHRNLNEALRAVHWEHLAAHKQRDLNAQIGIHVPDHVFNKEYNTVMHDAIHRAVTGKFTEPSGEGFKPHDYHIPLEHSLGMVREAAHNLGLTGMHDLVKKNEGTNIMADKIHEPKEWRQELAKALKDRVDAYSKSLVELRQRELKKAMPGQAPMPAPVAEPAPALNPMDLCPLCHKPDEPGQCLCVPNPAQHAPTAIAPIVKDESDMQMAEKCAGCSMAKAMCKCMSKSDKTHVCAAPLCTKGIKGDATHCKAHMPAEVKFHQDNAKATAAGKKGVPAKPGDGVAKKELIPNKTKDVTADDHGSGGEITKGKGLKKALPGQAKQMQQHAMVDASKAAAGAPKTAAPAAKMPSQADQAARQQMFADHMPKPAAPAAPAGMPKPAAMAAPKLPGMAKPTAAPPAGTAHLAAPPKPTAAAPQAMKPSPTPVAKPAPAAAQTTPGAAPKMGLLDRFKNAGKPKPAAPALKSESETNDLRKSLGSCLFCNKAEHPGRCS